ncbi:MAG: DUF169 domain-containing protein [Oryzomonas sp.]|uniref:DUF169 domain-containing protein n=1 Tax=Oryzomonas sp. TaxID=2855186 RepID=UPI002844ED70|nr:DUF169 domain-containing protein [Oryzomonas sp.]MDR3580212.1 DUF169 domain-containing protein [Oryzomonas sp.]
MNRILQDKFLSLWSKHFDSAQLPICLFYSDDASNESLLRHVKGRMCLIGQLANAYRGDDIAFTGDTIGCFGGKRFLGFSQALMPNFEHFLSCGIPGQMEGERYKKSPELVREFAQNAPVEAAPAKYAVFKRWDRLAEEDCPEVVIFFAPPDVLSGLFTLAAFDECDRNSVIAPFGAGCASIVQYPLLEGKSAEPRAVLGMFDVTARPSVSPQTLSFAVPVSKFERMIFNMDESFLTTDSWTKIKQRIVSSQHS